MSTIDLPAAPVLLVRSVQFLAPLLVATTLQAQAGSLSLTAIDPNQPKLGIDSHCGTGGFAGTAAGYAAAAQRLECLKTLNAALAIVPASRSGLSESDYMTIQGAASDRLTEAETEEQKTAREWAENEFLGINWAIGAGYSWGRGPERVKEADVVNDIVRVKKDETDAARIYLGMHYLFGSGDFGVGPFASVHAGEGTDPIAFGLGLAFGWRDKNDAGGRSSAGWVLGVGYEWSDNVQVLGDGIVANQPLPVGEDQIRYKETSAGALMVMVSRKFRLSGPPDSPKSKK